MTDQPHSPAVPPMPVPVAWGCHPTEVGGKPAIVLVLEHATGKTVVFLDQESARRMSADLTVAADAAAKNGLVLPMKPRLVTPQ